MILTVTPNTSLDHILFVPTFSLNQTIRAGQVVQSMGGKPTDAAWILGELGLPSLALGFVAGRNGEQITEMLHQRGVSTDFIPVAGESRRNIVIIAEDGGGQSTITDASLIITPADVAALREQYLAALAEATCVILGGTLPTDMSPDFYTDFITLARERGVPTIFDASGPFLSAGIQAQPTYVKPNQVELEYLTGRPVPSLTAAHEAGRELQTRFQTSPIITLGEAGALAVLPDRAYTIPALEVEVINTAGAGDGVLAGLAAAVAQGRPIEDGLRLGFAAAAAVLLTPGTADCRQADVLRLKEQVVLEEI